VFGQPGVPSVPASAVPDDAWLLDVREPYEWQAGHVEGAVHVPMGELLERLGEVPTDREVVVVCKVGGRSAQVVQYLNQAGWSAVNLDGGMYAWAAAGRPMVSSTGAPPTVA
jgi:rhodanese-related sulfurtransferase